jgi:hypothetical protein
MTPVRCPDRSSGRLTSEQFDPIECENVVQKGAVRRGHQRAERYDLKRGGGAQKDRVGHTGMVVTGRVTNSVGSHRVCAQGSRPPLGDLVRAGEEPAVGPNSSQPAGREQVDKAKIFGQLEFGHCTSIEICSRNSRDTGCGATRLDKAALWVFADVEDAEGVAGRTVGIVKAVCPTGAKMNGVTRDEVMTIENVAFLHGKGERSLGC